MVARNRPKKGSEKNSESNFLIAKLLNKNIVQEANTKLLSKKYFIELLVQKNLHSIFDRNSVKTSYRLKTVAKDSSENLEYKNDTRASSKNARQKATIRKFWRQHP